MSGKAQRPPAGEPWVWHTRELLASDAWRSLSINARRFVDFLLIEHMGHGGKNNGKLKAPYKQLQAFGIGAHQATAAICEAEDLGVVDCHRGGMRVATLYAIGWLPQHDGRPAADRWRCYCNPAAAPKIRNLPVKQQAGLPVKQQADGANLPVKQQADSPENLPAKQQVLYRSSYHGEAEGAGEGLRLPGAGHPVVAGGRP